MILIDSGPLVALILRDDSQHSLCLAAASRLFRQQLVTTVPCLTEVLYFLGKRAGWNSQNNLWEWRRREKLLIHELSKQELDRADELMAKYADHPMDFADASLVIAAEVLEIKQIFTLDRHFHSYRLHDGRVLQVVP